MRLPEIVGKISKGANHIFHFRNFDPLAAHEHLRMLDLIFFVDETFKAHLMRSVEYGASSKDFRIFLFFCGLWSTVSKSKLTEKIKRTDEMICEGQHREKWRTLFLFLPEKKKSCYFFWFFF
jgi:hypothetical protein